MLIGSNKLVANCTINQDIHIYNAQLVTIVGCIIVGNIIAHESCQNLKISNCKITGSLIMPGVSYLQIDGNVMGSGGDLSVEQQLLMLEASKKYIKQDEQERMIQGIPRNDSLIY